MGGPRSRVGTFLGAAWVVLAVAAACAPAPETCGAGTSLLCLSDGTTCTCAPSCVDGCKGFALCGDNDTCVPCEAPGAVSCICNPDLALCLPTSWVAGEHLTFQAATMCADLADAPVEGSSASSTCEAGETACGTAKNGFACCCESSTTECTTSWTSDQGCGYCVPTGEANDSQYCGTGTDGSGRQVPEYCPPGEYCMSTTASAASAIRYGCCPNGKACAGTKSIDCTLSPDAGTDAASTDELPTSPAVQAPPNK